MKIRPPIPEYLPSSLPLDYFLDAIRPSFPDFIWHTFCAYLLDAQTMIEEEIKTADREANEADARARVAEETNDGLVDVLQKIADNWKTINAPLEFHEREKWEEARNSIDRVIRIALENGWIRE